MSLNLENKVILVAGGSSGIGLALVKQAVSLGAHVHVVGRSTEKLALVQASLGSSITTHCADIGIECEVEEIARTIPVVDHLVTTAAALVFKPFLETSRADIDSMLGSKLIGPINLVKHLAPRMPHSGSITFYSGLAAYKANAGASIVAAVNGALDGLARTLAIELAPIRVNVVSPGVVDSPTWDFLPADTRSGALGSIGDALPVGRVGTITELANAGLFLIANGFATGTVLQIDGGANA